MPIEVVAIEQDTDETTNYIQRFRVQHVYSHPTLTGTPPALTLIECFNADAVPAKVYPAVQRPNVRFITGAGHGAYDVFTGQHGVTIWDASTVSEDHVRGKLIHLLSCQTGAILGINCVQKGAHAFWGYSVSFIFPLGPDYTVDTDNFANLFLGMDAIIDHGIFTGRDAQTIYDSIVRYFAQAYPLVLVENADWAAFFLDDFVHLVCPVLTWGDPVATL